MRAFIIAISIPIILLRPSVAAIIENKPLGLRRDQYSLKEACTFMGHKEVLVVEALGQTKIDCMGEIIETLDFCQKKQKEGPQLEGTNSERAFTRGVIDKEEKVVYCEKAIQVQLTLKCDSRYGPLYCKDALAGCQKLKDTFAHDLNLGHKAIVTDQKIKNLECYFSAVQKNISIDKEVPLSF